MSLNDTPNSLRTHIGFFGKTNAGKSSLVNAVTDQDTAVVSDIKGTTTDPVYKTMEILPLGPVVVIDTPGYDDKGILGEKRIKKTTEILNKTDIAVLTADATLPLSDEDKNLIDEFKKRNIGYIIAYNKCDLAYPKKALGDFEICVSAKNKLGINELRELMGKLLPEKNKIKLLGDFIKKGDTVVFVTPIDESAPKGRLILPQQQAIRDVLDTNGVSLVVGLNELENALDLLKQKPKVVVTDSQVFGKVNKIVPDDVMLTSFSVLMARFKGLLTNAVKGASYIDKLKDGDKVLISEGCTHHRQCNDIGTVKLPAWLTEYTKKDLKFEYTSGNSFPEDLSGFSLVVHCGGCMLNEREIKNRTERAVSQNVPITNYGTAIAHINGILKRSLEIMPEYSDNI